MDDLYRAARIYHANLGCPPRILAIAPTGFEFIAMNVPPYAFRRITVTRGTSARAKACGNRAPRTGLTLQSYSEHVLFGPLGMTSATWKSDPEAARAGAGPADRVRLEISPRDMARFGLLVLAQGWWADASILDDPDYLRAALSTSQDFNPSYGLLWWLNGKVGHELPGDNPQPIEGPIIAEAPSDLVAALGTSDQKIYVAPSLDLVIARQGGPAGPPDLTVSSFDNTWWHALSAAAASP